MCEVLVVSFSDLGRDARVDRQLAFLSRHWDVTAAALGPPDRDVRFVSLAREEGERAESALERGRRAAALAARRHEAAYWTSADVRRALARLRGLEPRVIVANDVSALPLALRLAAGRSRVLFDAHEYAPRQFEDIWWWRWLFGAQAAALCARYIPRVDAMCTVSPGIADRYAADTGVRPAVIRNVPFYAELEPRPVGERLRMVHFGAADPARRLEDMIATMRSLDERFSLDFVLVSRDGDGYVRRLRALAAGDERIRFLPPVAMGELTTFANAYDVGVYLLRADNFNRRFALPNKIFEFVQARLAVAVGPSPEMARLVREHGLGVVAEDERPESLAAALSALDAGAVWEYKQRSHAAAGELCAEREGERMVALVAGLLEGRRYPPPPLVS